jgi:hypothetical protein
MVEALSVGARTSVEAVASAKIYTIPENGQNNNTHCRRFLSSGLEHVFVSKFFDVNIHTSASGPLMQLPQRYDQGINR